MISSNYLRILFLSFFCHCHALVIVPEFNVTYNWQGKIIDTIGHSSKLFGVTGFEPVNADIIKQFHTYQPLFINAWKEIGPTIFQEVYACFKRGFKQHSRNMIISLGATGGYGSSNILFLGIRSYIDSTSWDLSVSRQDVFVNLVFHELLHVWMDDNLDYQKSTLLKKYCNETDSVREHVYLMAIQKMVYLKLNRIDLIELIAAEYQKTGGDYKRAWEIVDDIEGSIPRTVLSMYSSVR